MESLDSVKRRQIDGHFSHDERLRETLLGSLTGEILKEMDIPVLMVN